MPTAEQWAAARARHTLNATLRSFFGGEGFLEVEAPALVPTPGLELHIDAFAVPFVPQTDVGRARSLYLHTSPEYALKRLLADEVGGPLFSLSKVFRNGEVSPSHNPEFTLLEFYRPHVDYRAIMEDLERALARVEQAIDPRVRLFSKLPYERLTVREAVKRHSGIELSEHSQAASLKAAVQAAGVHTGSSTAWDDIFFHLFLQKVEPSLGLERPTFLIEYPASMASLARLKPGEPAVAERVELYARGVELANGFSELTDEHEQRGRLQEEQALRRAAGRPVYPLDENFLKAVARLPPCAGIAVGLDRVLMLLLGARDISEVLLFPAKDFV